MFRRRCGGFRRGRGSSFIPINCTKVKKQQRHTNEESLCQVGQLAVKRCSRLEESRQGRGLFQRKRGRFRRGRGSSFKPFKPYRSKGKSKCGRIDNNYCPKVSTYKCSTGMRNKRRSCCCPNKNIAWPRSAKMIPSKWTRQEAFQSKIAHIKERLERVQESGKELLRSKPKMAEMISPRINKLSGEFESFQPNPKKRASD